MLFQTIALALIPAALAYPVLDERQLPGEYFSEASSVAYVGGSSYLFSGSQVVVEGASATSTAEGSAASEVLSSIESYFSGASGASGMPNLSIVETPTAIPTGV